MAWPWEEFNWGVFWAFAVVLSIRGFFRWLGEVFDRLVKHMDSK